MKKLTFLKSLLLAIGLLAGNIGAWAQYSGTGTFTKITSIDQLTDGYYVIVNSGDAFAMNNTNTSSYFGNTSVTPSSGKITDPSTAIVWKISPHADGGYTIFNEASSKYVSYTGSSNAAYAVSSVSGGSERWNITYSSNVFSVANVATSTRILQYNAGSPRFACYTSAQQKLLLYKLDSSSNQAATPTFSPAAGTYTSAQSVTISCTTEGASIYYTTDGTDPNNTGNGTLYSTPISVTSTTTIKAIAYASGYDPSAIASATYTINVAPTITVTEVTLPAFSATAGSSQDQTITVNGTNLTDNITLALSGTDADVFSLSEYTITPTAGSVTDKVITITYAPTAPGSHTDTLTLSSSGATDVTRYLTGTATLAKPTVNTASNIGKTALTLNWNAVTGATSYEVNVYTKTVGAEMTDKESFDGITPDATGKLIESATYATGWSASSQSTTRQIYTTTGNFGTASPSFALTTTGDFIQTNTYASPITSFSFWAKQQSGTTSSTLIEGYNGSTWVTIATLSNNDVSSTSGETKTYNLTALGFNNITQIKMTYTKVQGNLSIDDVTVTYGGSTITPVSGSPFTTTETSLQVSGLTAATTYYYTVTAKNGTYVSPASDEASASTLGTATPNVSVQGIFVRNGKVIVTASAAGQRIEVYNTLGQRLVNVVSKEGENEISVPSKGIFMVKCGTEINKIILP